MKTLQKETAQSVIACIVLLLLPANVRAWEPNNNDLDAAINTGDFAGYFSNISTWLNQKVPADASGISEAAMTALLKDPVLANALDQRQLLSKHGVGNVGAFAKADQNNKTFLTWLLRNAPAMDLYLEGAVPLGIAAREQNSYTLNTVSLDIWKRIFFADPDSKDGLYLRLAIATALAPPGSGSPGAGQAKPPVDPVERYQHFKAAHRNKELFPSFDNLTVWEYQKVVQSGASNGDLAWAREMINTWRPDLRIKEQVVGSTSEVWYRNSPHPFTDYKTVLSGGGKCGPRSSWAVMICQAFGIPAIGVGQPAHACVAYKVADPSLQPQPGSAWKVGYGRGWQWSKLEGMSGPDFLAAVEQRSRVTQFFQVEHLRWLASTLASKEQAAAVMGVARKIQQSAPAVQTDLAASAKAAEAEKELIPEAKAAKAPVDGVRPPIKVSSGATRIEAAAISGMSGVRVLDCFTGGKQVNFDKNVQNSWVDYTLDVAAAGTYGLEIKVAAANLDQVLNVKSGDNEPVTIKVPYTTGLWGTTPAVNIKLAQGKQTLRISAPFQRGVAVRHLELKSKDQ
jgi:hypothetical protein